MEVNMIIKLHQKHLDKYKKRYPLLFKEALMGAHQLDQVEEGTLLKLVDTNNKFIATAYYGIQNKGLGWVLSNRESERIDELFFTRKIYQSIEKRLGLYNNPKTNCFRVFNGEGDGIGGLTIDYFNGYYLINYYSKGIYHFKALIEKALSKSVEYDAIYEKMRFSEDGDETPNDGFVMGKPAAFPILVRENDVQFAIYFNDGAMVGLFLDQRDVRRAIRHQYAKGKVVLNTFAYTGAFSVFAALGGAKQVYSVDLANRTSERITENYQLNDVNPESHPVIIEDIFNYFKFAQKKNLKYDLVILDPPSFAKSKQFTFSAEKDYPELLADAIRITEPGGIIIASTNAASFDMAKFKQLIGKGFNLARARFEIVETFKQPRDFKYNHAYPEGNYLKVLAIRVEKPKLKTPSL
jgi:23S rRNA (cytosine1962-C5)-methyltransferase